MTTKVLIVGANTGIGRSDTRAVLHSYLGVDNASIVRAAVQSKVLVAPAEQAQAASNSVANLIAPYAFEVANIADVNAEIFGPVLQVVRWTGEPGDVIAQINALGYGLTLGIQTRIDSRAQALAHAAHVGNVYINRNMIGAVVGVLDRYMDQIAVGSLPLVISSHCPFLLYRCVFHQ